MIARISLVDAALIRSDAQLTPVQVEVAKAGWAQLVFLGAPAAKITTLPTLEEAQEVYDALKKGGSVVVFVDLMSLSEAAQILEKVKFKQLRYVQTLDQEPGNFYPSSNRLMAIVAVKQGGSTFNVHYHSGSFGGRGGPDENAALLVSELVANHTHVGDIIAAKDGTTSDLLKAVSVVERFQEPASPEEVEKWVKKNEAYRAKAKNTA